MENNQNTESYSISSGYSVSFEVQYPERSSRLLALLGIPWLSLKVILLIPHLIVMYFLNLASLVAVWFSYWAILFTGKYPKVFFEFVVGVMRWQIRINSWMFSLTDKYPPFSLK